jgi:hypothetical protein
MKTTSNTTHASIKSVNPFFDRVRPSTERFERDDASTPRTHAASVNRPSPRQAIYAKLPEAPITASPVPHLTSLYHDSRTGEYGDRRYPGNCGGLLIRDLITFFRPKNVLDPMTGSGTCREVCRDLNVPCLSLDMHSGFDAAGTDAVQRVREIAAKTPAFAHGFDFLWSHPPYWRQKLYTNDPRDLSRTPTLDAFLARYGQFIRNGAELLSPRGKFAILMGDYTDREAGFVPLTYHTKRLAFDAGLRQCCTDIVRFSHGNSSSAKVYRSSFIPGLHDVCMIFERAS